MSRFMIAEGRKGMSDFMPRYVSKSKMMISRSADLLRFDITEYNGKLCELCDFEKGLVSHYTLFNKFNIIRNVVYYNLKYLTEVSVK